MVTSILIYVIGALLGYVFGAFPTGYFVGLMWNVDVRKHGSGRTGGTNVLRAVGWKAFALTVTGDVLKGVIPILLARAIWPTYHGAHAAATLGVLVGHNWSVWIALLAKSDSNAHYSPPPLGWIQKIAEKGRGGAGVATTAGAILALFAPAALVIAPFSIGILLVFRYASLASLSAAIFFPFVMFYFVLSGGAPWSYFFLAIAASVIIIAVHAPNIQRLRTGTERRFGQRLGRERSS